MSGLIKQAQKLQADMQKTQAELETKVLEGSSGGGAVVVEVTGKKEMTSIKINPDVMDDVEMLQDVIMAAVNEVIRNVEDTSNEELSKITGSLSIPGLF